MLPQDHRTSLLFQHADLLALCQTYEAELARYGDADPALYHEKVEAGRIAKQEACRWTGERASVDPLYAYASRLSR